MVRGTLFRLLPALLLGLALAPPPGAVQAQSDSSVPLFSTHTKAPRLNVPKAHDQPKMNRLGTPVRFVFDPASLKQAISPNLSRACAANKFNQKRKGRYFVKTEVPGKVGPKRLGMANSRGLNLRDPEDKAFPNQIYLFDLDGTSECTVYVYPMEGQ